MFNVNVNPSNWYISISTSIHDTFIIRACYIIYIVCSMTSYMTMTEWHSRKVRPLKMLWFRLVWLLWISKYLCYHIRLDKINAVVCKSPPLKAWTARGVGEVKTRLDVELTTRRALSYLSGTPVFYILTSPPSNPKPLNYKNLMIRGRHHSSPERYSLPKREGRSGGQI